MNKRTLACLFATFLATTYAAETQLEVYVTGISPQLSEAAFTVGQLKAAELLEPRGMKVRWIRGKPSDCAQSPRSRRLVLDIQMSAPPSAGTLALARTDLNARCPEPKITLYWERIRVLEPLNPVAQGHVVGYVLTHELIHATGTREHEEEGLMKPVWSREDLWMMDHYEERSEK